MAESLTTEREAQPPGSSRARRAPSRVGAKVRGHFRYALPGAWVALVFVALSLTPSLLPRPPAYQGAVTGLSAVIGYGIGILGS